MQIEADASSWESWWEFHKDPFVRSRDAAATGRGPSAVDAMLGRAGVGSAAFEPPTPADVRGRALPALAAALAVAADRDTVTGCMVAMAKIGIDLPGTSLHDQFKKHLASKDQEVRETAALCLGIARQCTPRDLDLLQGLVRDTAGGRAACARANVDERTRAFAAYALGLCLERATPAQAAGICRDLLEVLADPSTQRNLTVATIAALGQVGQQRDVALAHAVVDGLEAFYGRDLGPGDQLLQAHVPPVIARLLGCDDARSAHFRDLVAAELGRSLERDARSTRTNLHLAQSCALALGELTRPWTDAAAPDAAVGELLLRVWRDHRDQQTRYFAMLALGRIGGAEAQRLLLLELERANRSLEKPWVALALAAVLRADAAAGTAPGRSPQRDEAVGKALLGVLDEVKNPSAVGATAIALGMAGVTGAADRLRALLHAYDSRDDVAGQLAIALSLLGQPGAAADLRALLPRCLRRPQLLVQIATALGRLGDGNVVGDLTGLLAETDGGLARLSAIAMAIGQVGDRRCIDPLVAMLGNEHLTPLTRAFAAVALGGVCDRDPLPWNARFAWSLNYRAAVETLTDGAAGILDIL